MMTKRRINAFSLIEVTLAIGVIAFALVAILGLLPVGMRSGREAMDATRTSLIAQDVVTRLRASLQSNDSSSQFYFAPYATGTASFFFYTSEGTRTSDGSRTGELLKVQAPSDQPKFYVAVGTKTDFYRAKVVVNSLDQTANFPSYDPRKVSGSSIPNLLCATIEIGWPVNKSDGSILVAANKATYTVYLRKP
jgi:uncharacterized protein (TIGR02598 family)